MSSTLSTTSQSSSVKSNNEHQHIEPERHLSLFDLICIGVGGTIGSGIFVLTGQIASQQAGSLTFVTWIIAGIATALSGLCFAELAGRIHDPGSTYAYARLAMGDAAAVVAAACLTLEYAVSGAAVARSWGEKLVLYLVEGVNVPGASVLEPNAFINIPAALISLITTLLLLWGVKESKMFTNAFTMGKLLLVGVMVVGGFVLFAPSNFQAPMTPLGFGGIIRGAVSAFFGYIGFDEVCVMAGEAKNPRRNMPRAVLGTIVIVTICYVLASVSLVGMINYSQISPVGGFGEAFQTRGVEWLAQVTYIGELVFLPVTVLISLLAQPRLTYAMACDKLAPAIFLKTSKNGNFSGGIFIAGTGMTIIALCIPFTYLDDFISAGILIAFCLADTILILMRRTSPASSPKRLPATLGVYHVLCFCLGLFWHYLSSGGLIAIPIIATIAWFACFIYIGFAFPKTSWGGKAALADDDMYFSVPLMPYLPTLGIAVNWCLIAQLEWYGLLALLLYLGLAVALYYAFGRRAADAETEEPDNKMKRMSTFDTKIEDSTEEGDDCL